MVFYERLASCCANAGTNVTTFTVDVLGLSKSTPTNWKKGVNYPNADTVIKVAKYFGVSSDYLLGLSDHSKSIDYLSDSERELLSLFRAADSKDAEVALSSFRAIIATCNAQKRIPATSSHLEGPNSDLEGTAF